MPDSQLLNRRNAVAIDRAWMTTTVVTHTDLASSGVLDTRDFDRISIRPPTGVTELTFYGSAAEDGTFELINDAGTAGVLAVTAERWVAFPAAVLAHGFVKIKSTTATGTATIVAKC